MDMDTGISQDYLPMDPKRLLERFHTALNSRDITNLLLLLQVDYEQSWPGLAGRKMTTGQGPFREEWQRIFEKYPHFRADLISKAIEGNQIWSEWHWKPTGEQSTGSEEETARDVYGVVIFGVEEGLLAWGRYYMR